MKIISISSSPTEKIEDSFGEKMLYPNSTIRVIEKWIPFKGKVKIRQICSVECWCGSDATIYYNKWRKTEYRNEILIKKINKIKDRINNGCK